VHKTVPAHIHTVARGMAEGRCCTCCQGTIRVTSQSSKLRKELQIFLRHRWNAILGAGDNVWLICSHSDMLRKYLHRIRHRIRHRILYIVYDIVGIHDVVYDIIYCTSYTTSYTMSYAISFFTTTEIYSAGLTAPASRLRFRVSAPLSLES